MKTFTLVRNEDASGVSGTGEVAEGVEFNNGKCVMCWDTKTSSIAVYESIDDLIAIHGHEGRTVAKFEDGTVVTDAKRPERGDRVVITEANYPSYIGVEAVVLTDEEYGEVEIALDKSPNDWSPKIQDWKVDWLRKI